MSHFRDYSDAYILATWTICIEQILAPRQTENVGKNII